MIDHSKFATKSELFKYLIENKSDLLALKKAAVKNAEVVLFCEDESEVIDKAAVSNLGADDLINGIIKRTIVGNTYGWMDSHYDVHIKGIFTKSISENKNIVHLHDHVQMITAKVGTPINIYEKSIKWTDLGVNKEGKTTALMMDSEIKRAYNELVYEEYLNKQINQHSVGMRYVKIFLAINDENYKEEFANWNTYIGNVANKDKAEEVGYFWAVTEAKLIEISCVIAGSNEVTPTLNNKFTPEPDKSTQPEPNEDEELNKAKEAKKLLLIKYLS